MNIRTEDGFNIKISVKCYGGRAGLVAVIDRKQIIFRIIDSMLRQPDISIIRIGNAANAGGCTEFAINDAVIRLPVFEECTIPFRKILFDRNRKEKDFSFSVI